MIQEGAETVWKCSYCSKFQGELNKIHLRISTDERGVHVIHLTVPSVDSDFPVGHSLTGGRQLNFEPT